jgi:pimeloyl-ACP methyl ester carboxylesterase
LLLLLLPISIYSQRNIIDGIPKLVYWEYGNSDQIIIIINGGPGLDHKYLQPEWDTLSSVSKIVYYDQRGCGESNNSTNYSWIEHLKDLKRLKNHLSPARKVILAASSWGTNLAILYSIYYPDDVNGLILSGFTDWIGINPKKVDLYDYQIDSINNFKRILPLSFELDSIRKTRFTSSRNLSSKSNLPETMDPNFSKRLHQNSREVNIQTTKSLRSMPDLTHFAEISVPTLIIRGDLYCGYADWSDILTKKILTSELYTIMNSCHDPWYSNSNIFFAKCIEFIVKIH